MKLEEKIDNYLISIGCSISSDYSYIAAEEYNYQKKEKEETLKITGKDVQLNIKSKNTIALNNVVLSSSYNFTNFIKGVIEKKSNKTKIGDDDVLEICNYVDTALKAYYTDYIKYVRNNFTLTESILENLINLINANINNTKESLNMLLQKNNMKMLEAVQKAAADRSSSEAGVLAEIANSPKTTYASSYLTSGLLYDKVYTRSVTAGAMSNTTLRGQLSGSSLFASGMEDIYKNDGNYSTIVELADIVDKLVAKYNKDLQEILVIKFSDLFNKDIYSNTKNVEKNPLYVTGYFESLEEIKEEDLENIKKAFSYYDIDIKEVLDLILSDLVLEKYSNNKKYELNEIVKNLYLDVYNKSDLCFDNIQDGLYEHFNNAIESRKVTSYGNEKFLDITDDINTCNYLNKDNKTKLLENIDIKVSNAKMWHKAKIGDMRLAIIFIVIFVIFAVFTVCYFLSHANNPKTLDNLIVIVCGIITYALGSVIWSSFIPDLKEGIEEIKNRKRKK